MKCGFVTILILVTGLTNAQSSDSIDVVTLPLVAEELKRMHIEDQRYRGQNDPIFETTPWTDSLEHWVWQRQSEIDVLNMNRLGDLIDQHGWLSVSKVGSEAATAVFLIVQHAELENQEKYLPLMRIAVEHNDFPARYLAYLEDRVRMHKGELQLYGTQMMINQETGATEVYPIEDEVNVDTRRASVGLGPLVDYCRQFGIEYKPLVDSAARK